MTTLRKATIDDYEQVLRIKRQVHSLHVNACPDYYKEIDTPFSKEAFENVINSDYVEIYVLSEKNEVLGYAFINKRIINNHPIIIDQKIFYIDDFCIDEKFRGKGFGKELFEKLEESAKDNGFTSIDLEVWAFNEPAKEFYEKIGMDCNRLSMRKPL